MLLKTATIFIVCLITTRVAIAAETKNSNKSQQPTVSVAVDDIEAVLSATLTETTTVPDQVPAAALEATNTPVSAKVQAQAQVPGKDFEPNAYITENPNVDQCKQIVVVGDTDWVPYTTRTETGIAGVGIDLVKQIFAQLDIPVKELEFTDKRSIYHGLRLGDIDLLVSMYPDGELDGFLDIMEPGYSADPITVLMRKGQASGIKRWDDLIGQRGVTTGYFPLETGFAEYANRYLYVHQQSDLAATLEIIKKRKADYMLGSKLQLEYALKLGNNQDEFELLTAISAPTEVRMGFSKKSACRVYLPFLRKNLLELKDAGEIKVKVATYLEKAAIPSLTKAEQKKENDSEFDYLFGL